MPQSPANDRGASSQFGFLMCRNFDVRNGMRVFTPAESLTHIVSPYRKHLFFVWFTPRNLCRCCGCPALLLHISLCFEALMHSFFYVSHLRLLCLSFSWVNFTSPAPYILPLSHLMASALVGGSPRKTSF